MFLTHFVPFYSRLWLSLTIIIGLAVGRAEAAWHDLSSPGFPGDALFDWIIITFAAIGSAFILSCIFYLLKSQATRWLFGMERTHWLVGAPLAWLCGIAVGIFWKYL